MHVFADIQTGKAIPEKKKTFHLSHTISFKIYLLYLPFFISFSFLKTLLVSSNIKLSPHIQTSRTDAPSTHFSITSTRTPKN